MNVERYLERMGLSPTPKAPSCDYLDELVNAHQFHVPFETIDVYDLHRVPLLGIDDLFDKIVVRRRGGYCFEMNGLFFALLKELGFDVWPCLFRINPRGEWGPANHRGTIVRLDGALHYVDVGMGGAMPSFALPMDGKRYSALGETYWVEPLEDGKFLLRRLKSAVGEDGAPAAPAEATMGIFDPAPVGEEAFEQPNRDMAEGDDAPFRRGRQANMRIPGGHCTIAGDVFSTTVDGVRTETPINGNLAEILREHFGIVVPELA